MENFYVLMIVNHKTREFHTRVEEERGDPASGSKHCLLTYVASMGSQVTKNNLDVVKDHFMMPFWRGVLNDIGSVEQFVLARVEANDVYEAREKWKANHRDSFRSFYKSMGYRAFNAEKKVKFAKAAAMQEEVAA